MNDQFKSLKLSLINRILKCNDIQVLHTLDQLLDLDGPVQSQSDDILATSPTIFPGIEADSSSAAIEELRQSIDDVFQGK